jgi:hypothetical protein
MTAFKSIDELTDNQIENCFEGSSDVAMVRRITKKYIDENGYVDVESFSQEFAEGIEGFITEEEDTDEWNNVWYDNRNWGEIIAENINEILALE